MEGTYIPVYVQKDGQNHWRNRKEFLSQNVLAVVGFDMRFHYILAGWKESATDARILYSALEDNLHPLKIPHEYVGTIYQSSMCQDLGKLRQKKNCTAIDTHLCALLWRKCLVHLRQVSEIINDDENTEQTQICGTNNELRQQITSTMWNDYVSKGLLRQPLCSSDGRSLLEDARDINVEELLAIFIQTVGHNRCNRACQNTCQQSG
ncbi:hypothetical protein EJ110_NYTH39903 [Nymphaea thermarum]|nr:hypothetical protein EJ110_NYTH39903 [Nymphaea thermarum]